MDSLTIAKKAATFVVGSGVSKITASIIANNTNPEKLTERVSMYVGAGVLGMMAADASKKFTSAKIDTYVAYAAKLKTKIEEAQKKQKEESTAQAAEA